MSYFVQCTDHPEIALIEFSGRVHLKARTRALAALEALLFETGLRRVLVDFSSSTSFGAMTLEDALRHARRMADLSAHLRHLRIAYVYPPRRPPVVELIAASRGFRFEQFAHRRAALAWLASDSAAIKSAA